MEGALPAGAKVAGRYVIVRMIGRGGMGAVYEARHEELGRHVALKVLLPELARDADTITRFFREARTAAALHHPGIVEVFDLGRDGEMAFIVMEKLVGEELSERIRLAGRLGPRFVASVGIEIADAISAAHEHGVVHRDLKPQNVFLSERGRDQEEVKILDFGIAKLADSEAAEAHLTRTGQVFGTPLYMPPEQLHGRKDIDSRADIYSIGVILYEALAGQPPFAADTYPSLVLKIVEGKPPSLAELRTDVPAELVAIIERAMAPNRDQRFSSAAALADALAEVVQTLPDDPVLAPRQPAARSEPGEPGDDFDQTARPVTPVAAAPVRSLAVLNRSGTSRPPGPTAAEVTGPPEGISPPAKRSRLPLAFGGLIVVAAAAGTGLFLLKPPGNVVPAVSIVVQPAPEPVAVSIPDAGAAQVAAVDHLVADPPPAPSPVKPPQPVVPNGPKTKKKPPPIEDPQPGLLPR